MKTAMTMMKNTLMTAALVLMSAAMPGAAATVHYSFTVQELKQAVANESSFAGGACTGEGYLQLCGIHALTIFNPDFENPSITTLLSPIPSGTAAWSTELAGNFGEPTFRDDNGLVNIAFVTNNGNTVGREYFYTGQNSQIGTTPMSNDAVFSFLMTVPDSLSGTVSTTFWVALEVIAFDANGIESALKPGGHMMQMEISGSEVPEASTWMMAVGALAVFAGMRNRRSAA